MEDGIKILIIDDEAFFAQNLAEYLRRSLKVEVRVATDIASALKAIKDFQFDLIISDLNIDGMDRECHLLKLGEVAPGTPVIIVSSMAIPAHLPDDDRLNICTFFEKPFDVNDLKKYIDQKFKLKESHTTN